MLNKDCILERYHPLIPFKDELVNRFKTANALTKDDAIECDDIMMDIFKDEYLVKLFKVFLNMYEVNKSKLREIDKLNLSEEERKSYQELYLLPGVKATRARLYYLSSLKSLNDIAVKTPEEIIKLTKNAIIAHNLDCKEPLFKEANTHIAVAKLMSAYLVK